MGTTLTIEERAALEQKYLDMIDGGLSIQEMAVELGVTKQAVRKFLMRRKWTARPAAGGKD